MSGRYGLKRSHESGSAKRTKRNAKIVKSVENTKSLFSYFANPPNQNNGEGSNTGNDDDADTSESEDNLNINRDIPADDDDIDDVSVNSVDAEDVEPRSNENSDDDDIDNNDGTDNDSSTEVNEAAVGDGDDGDDQHRNPSNTIDLSNEFPTDRGILPADVTDPALKRTIIEHGPCKPTWEKYFTNPEGKPNFIESYYTYSHGDINIPRQWLCYSPTLNRPYCEVCWLFADRGCQQNRAWIDGVAGNTHNMSTKISKHEQSQQHIDAARDYGRWKTGKTIDEEAEQRMKLNVSFWTKVLHRLISIILTLCALNLALRGHREKVGEGVGEDGNFLGLVALVAQYDEVLSEVISLPYRATKYMSNIIQEEIIKLLGSAVRKSLISKIKCAPFWSVILDTTSDVTRVDQLSVIIRWVYIGGDKFEIVESFLGFVEVTDADARGLVDTTKNYLKGLVLTFSKLRGQGYDGASVMSGVRGGVQKLIKEMCDSPVPFVHCASHNLNLVINDSVESIPQNEKFFENIQDIFIFFGKSLNRWRELTVEGDTGSLTLKKLCTTRWTSRIDSVRALRDRYVHILKVLTRLSLVNENSKEKSTAIGLRKKMESYEFIVFIVFWERLLRTFNTASRELQSPKVDLSAASRLLNCARNELQHLRDNYQSVLDTATAIAISWDIKPTFTHSQRYFFGNQRYINDIKDPTDFLKINIFYRTIDVAMTELRVRFAGQNSVTSVFSFLYPCNLKETNSGDIEKSVRKLLESYHRDFSENLISETRAFVTEFKTEIAEKHTVRDLLQLLYDYKLISSFPEFQKLLTLFLTIPVTVASAERSFSKLKLIKTYLRSKMEQCRLTNLAILSIENSEANALDKSELIRKFASANAVREAKF